MTDRLTIAANAIRTLAQMHEDLTGEAMMAASVEDEHLAITIGQVQTQLVVSIKVLIQHNRLEQWWRQKSGVINADVNLLVNIY
jgi:hypothetical protein